jgi:hypothetical protein
MELVSRNHMITRAVLQGGTVSFVAREWGISKGRCTQIVHEVCRKLEPELYCSLKSPGLSGASLKLLRQYVDVFIEQMGSEPVLTPFSSIRRIPSLPSTTLNGLLKVGILTVGDLMKCKPEFLLRIPVIGRIGLRKIQDALESIETANRD